jgi:hypothetical protein
LHRHGQYSSNGTHTCSFDHDKAASSLSHALPSTARVNRSHDPETMLRSNRQHQSVSRPPLATAAKSNASTALGRGSVRLELG